MTRITRKRPAMLLAEVGVSCPPGLDSDIARHAVRETTVCVWRVALLGTVPTHYAHSRVHGSQQWRSAVRRRNAILTADSHAGNIRS